MYLKKLEGFKNIRELALSTFYYIGGSIFGPLVIFLSLGYFLDKFLQTKPTMFIIGFFVAFLISNVLLFQKISKINRLMKNSQLTDKKEEEKN